MKLKTALMKAAQKQGIGLRPGTGVYLPGYATPITALQAQRASYARCRAKRWETTKNSGNKGQ